MSEVLMEQTAITENVILAQQGDAEAFGRLVRHSQNAITSIALAIVRDLDGSEDVAQKAYIAAWQRMHELNNANSFLPWLRQITRNLAKNFLRDNKTEQRISSEEAEILLEQFSDPKDNHETQLERSQIADLVDDFISQLPADSRELVLLYYREQQNTQHVAKLLGISEENVRQRLSRARLTLKQNMIARYGKLLLNTAPTITFSALVLSSLTVSSPIAAATVASSMASSKSTMIGKILALFGGALLGSFMGVLAVILSSKIVIHRLNDEQMKRQVTKNRNAMILWIIVSGLLLTAAYEFTSGWWGPVTAYLIFAIGLLRYCYTLYTLLDHNLCARTPNPWRNKIAPRILMVSGIVLGLGGGFTGLIIGLMNSGRLII